MAETPEYLGRDYVIVRARFEILFPVLQSKIKYKGHLGTIFNKKLMQKFHLLVKKLLFQDVCSGF